MPHQPPLRSAVDRTRQILLFELGGLLLITPPFIWLSGVGAGEALGLLASAALIAAAWNAVYNTGFDVVEGRISGRAADRRALPVRLVQALGFELGLLLLSLPVVMAWTGMDWISALIADLGLALAYVAYAFVFNLAYDRAFPIASRGSAGSLAAD
ncbi:MAG: PACE efflux transporter [Rhodocyclaceae bacterium]|nr:PACE efflux transporter [Rhodocyclaceae bacterium]